MTSQMVQWKRTIMRLSQSCWFSHYNKEITATWFLLVYLSLLVCLCPQVSSLPGSVFNLAPPHMFGNRLNPNSTMAALIAQSEASPAGTAAAHSVAVFVCVSQKYVFERDEDREIIDRLCPLDPSERSRVCDILKPLLLCSS